MKLIRHAWIILENGKPACYDHRLPIFWNKKQAEEEAEEECLEGDHVSIVEVSIVEQK